MSAWHASVTLQTNDGQRHVLSHGDLIGRVWSAALVIEDPGVSEAHAMVSLRGAELVLLALRGLFAVGSKPVKQLTLAAGQIIRLSRDVTLTVIDVHLPDSVLALQAEGLATQPLTGVCGLVLRPSPRLVPNPPEHAVAMFWRVADGWRARVEDGPPVHLYPDWSAVCGGLHVKAIELPLSSSSSGRTRVELSVQHNLRIVGRFDHVHIHRDDQSVVRITGKQARLFNAVAEVGAPVHWSAIAEQIWPEVQHTHVQRRRWDTTMLRLRRHLQACGLRPDLLRNDGRGHFELGLEDGDIWEDQG